MNRLKILTSITVGLLLLIAAPAYCATYYVRTDGGSSTQCTGLADAAYPGSGSLQSCAFSHPNYAISIQGNNPTKMVGGDTLIIDGSDNAQYKMGWWSPNINDTSVCYSAWPWNCFMRAVPSGPDAAHPTRILGKGWDSGCSNPPQLWGAERASMVVNLSGSSNVELQCLEITDHSACQEHGPNACNRSTSPYGDWATTGLVATDSENVLLKNINIHGMAYRGIYAGRLKDWTIEDSRIVSNSFVGWDGDVGAYNSSNSGTMTFNRVSILYSGCGETYPGEQPYNCYSQDQGGYGDGLGTHQTSADWVFNNCDLSHNVSDGLDLLYHDGSGTITINRSRFEGNAGNQVKTGANAVISNSLIIGNCAYFANSDKTWNTSGFNNCRAGGNAIAVAFDPGTDVLIYNSTISSNGDTVLQSAGSNCDGTETLVSRNNIYLGGTEYNDGSDLSALYWAAGATGNGDGPCGSVELDDDYSVIYNTKYFASDCNGKDNSVCADPMFDEPHVQYYGGDAFDADIQASSPARGAGNVLSGKSTLDYNSFDRGGDAWDIGALEYGSTPQEDSQEPTCEDGIEYCTTQEDCEGYGYYWYDSTCNTEPEPDPTCADGVQYCTTQGDCEGEGHYWYNDTCNATPEPDPTCADGVQYCTTQGDCEARGYFWYNNDCHASAPTCADGIDYCATEGDCEAQGYYWYNNDCQVSAAVCADGIEYCTTQGDCDGQGYYWYNNTCNVSAEPDPTCADGIDYCSTQGDCEGEGYYWYNNTCNVSPEPDPTCADGIDYCSTQGDCEGEGYYWYDNTCNVSPEPDPTCADSIVYCSTQGDCESQGYYWYSNACYDSPEPEPDPTCADGIDYCTTQGDCEGEGYYWYNNVCNVSPAPTCADGIAYCTTQGDCEGQGYYWYNDTCNAAPQPDPTCADGVAYCDYESECELNGFYWYDGSCHEGEEQADPTCADGIDYCATQGDCEGEGYYWYNNTCDVSPEPEPEPEPDPTCADDIAYCATQEDCSAQGYFWYNEQCNASAQQQEEDVTSQEEEDTGSVEEDSPSTTDGGTTDTSSAAEDTSAGGSGGGGSGGASGGGGGGSSDTTSSSTDDSGSPSTTSTGGSPSAPTSAPQATRPASSTSKSSDGTSEGDDSGTFETSSAEEADLDVARDMMMSEFDDGANDLLRPGLMVQEPVAAKEKVQKVQEEPVAEEAPNPVVRWWRNVLATIRTLMGR